MPQSINNLVIAAYFESLRRNACSSNMNKSTYLYGLSRSTRWDVLNKRSVHNPYVLVESYLAVRNDKDTPGVHPTGP